MARARVFSGTVSTPAKTPVKIPLNDDRKEKANRLHSRQAQHEHHMNQIKAAATPLRKRRSLLGQSPHTPGDMSSENLPSIGGAAVTPMKRVPIMANFEEWMKMATDNKINATNSWNFALIDYFHDMSLLKEGDGVNFQRASCTLDGCVKIYTNRVDSVATETGKLLSGLAESNQGSRGGGEAEDEDAEGDEDEDGDESGKKRSKKRTQKTAEATLATSFSQLQLKKMELEFAIDPLFKKASADFDEGGAKGLLLNHLAIDSDGRIVFDSSDDAQEVDDEEQIVDQSDATVKVDTESTATDIDLSLIGSKFFPNLAILDEQDVCPSLKSFELGSTDNALDLPFLKSMEAWKPNAPQASDDHTMAAGFDDDDNLLGGLDFNDGVGFGDGGEAWAKEVALDPQVRMHPMAMENSDSAEAGGEDVEDDNMRTMYGISMRHGVGSEQQNILDYFDKALHRNWAGPEHWKIRRMKDTAKAAVSGVTKRKEREAFEIDFAAPMSQSLADALYAPVPANSVTCLPRSQWKSKTRNLLPDDKHFNSRQLLRLFLKPNAGFGKNRTAIRSGPAVNKGDVDEQFWAKQNDEAAFGQGDNEALQGNYDANFFQDDGFNPMGDDNDDDEFVDAQDGLSPPMESQGGEGVNAGDAEPRTQDGPFGAQLVTQSRRLRPEYVQYARVATKVDVRRLKEEIWKELAFEEPEKEESTTKIAERGPDETLQFTDVINGLQSVYPKQAMADISTSFCFICVLHLANEKGLVITNQDDFQNLTIKKDHSAEVMGVI